MATLILRNQKGQPLTNAEVDGNFSNLNTELMNHIGSYGASHNVATSTNNGFMSFVDKQKIDKIAVDISTGNITGTSFNAMTGLASTIPLMDGESRVGTSTAAARADHIHPTDTSRLPLEGADSITKTGNVTSGTWSASFGVVSGAKLTNITAGNLEGTIPSAVLGKSQFYIGSTPISLNRTSAPITLNDVSINGSSDSLNINNNYQVKSIGVGTAPSGVTGEIRATNDITAFYSSDRRLKENITPIENAVGMVNKLSGNRFTWSQEYIDSRGGEDSYFVRKKDVGVIAQEVQEILPEAVAERENGYLAVNYEKLVPLLIEAIKELSSEIEVLKSKSNLVE